MHRFAFSTPVLPGHDARELATFIDGREGEYLESRRRLGIHCERRYSGGAGVVTYLETDWDFGTTLRGMAQSDLPIDSDFCDSFWKLHGVEIGDVAAKPAPELIGEWLDPAITKRRPGLAFSSELVPGSVADARQFGEDAYHHRRYEELQSRRALPLTVERLYLDGENLILYMEADEPALALLHLAMSHSVHDGWFKQRYQELTGIYLGAQVPAAVTIWDIDLAGVPA